MSAKCQVTRQAIDSLKKQNIALSVSVSQLNAAVVALVNLYAKKDKEYSVLAASIKDSVKKYQGVLIITDKSGAVTSKGDSVTIKR